MEEKGDKERPSPAPLREKKEPSPYPFQGGGRCFYLKKSFFIVRLCEFLNPHDNESGILNWIRTYRSRLRSKSSCLLNFHQITRFSQNIEK